MDVAEITITVTGGLIRVEDEKGEVKNGTIVLDRLRRDTIDVLVQWIRQGKITRREELQVLGGNLYSLLFNGEIVVFFEKALSRVPEGARLRVKLSFDEASGELGGFPWEYLWYPEREVWFSTAVNLVLSRYLPSIVNGPEESLATDDHRLRVLAVVSQPTDSDITPVLSDPVFNALEKLKERLPIDIIRTAAPTSEGFAEVLSHAAPHVVHFMGHGRYQRSASPPFAEIALHAADGKAHWCRDQDFAELFVQARTRPRLVILHLCEGATVDANFNASFAGLAPKLVRRARIPAVVAMQHPIENRFAIQFSRTFYEQIANGEPIDNAVQFARSRLTQTNPEAYDNRVFGTPVLYMYSRSGIILVGARNKAPVNNMYAAPGPVASNALAAPIVSAPIPDSSSPAVSLTGVVNSGPTRERAEPSNTPRSNSGYVVARPGTIRPELRNRLREARRKTREFIDRRGLPQDLQIDYSRLVGRIVDEISQSPDAATEILDRYWEEHAGEGREIVDLLFEVINCSRNSTAPEAE
jgi:CHAT domain-containing protein